MAVVSAGTLFGLHLLEAETTPRPRKPRPPGEPAGAEGWWGAAGTTLASRVPEGSRARGSESFLVPSSSLRLPYLLCPSVPPNPVH